MPHTLRQQRRGRRRHWSVQDDYEAWLNTWRHVHRAYPGPLAAEPRGLERRHRIRCVMTHVHAPEWGLPTTRRAVIAALKRHAWDVFAASIDLIS